MNISSFKKHPIRYVFEILAAIAIALIVATIVRQMWFELYEIPTGSMRPSFREQDRLAVTKTTFGLNIPLETSHFYFDPELVKRARVFIFSGANITALDENSLYFGVIPYTKRYIKRMIGKPGDYLYFYGGKIYAVDEQGNFVTVLIDDPWMQKLEHIPFLSFEGTMTLGGDRILYIEHMGEKIARLRPVGPNSLEGEIRVQGAWKKERLENEKAKEVTAFGQFWGIENFAMARLLSRQELKEWTSIHPNDIEEAEIYLQLKHSPNLTYPVPRLYKAGQRVGLQLPAFESIIPLKKEHIERIKEHIYTSRFIVKNGKVARYSVESPTLLTNALHFPGVEDGTYEIFNGQAERIGFYGWPTKLPQNHPLNNPDIEQVKRLFNYGIEMFSVSENAHNRLYYPNRYAYYRDGDLYLLGAPIFKRDDPVLKHFVEKEKEKAHHATQSEPYKPFLDSGPPLKNGTMDLDFIKTFGLKIPEKSYVALGDNHAMSMDSRLFGFVPENNIQGAPAFVLWPPGERWGMPPQTPYPFLSLPRIFVWVVVAILCLTWFLIQKIRKNR